MKILLIIYLIYISLIQYQEVSAFNKSIPLVVITWDYENATQRGNCLYIQRNNFIRLMIII